MPTRSPFPGMDPWLERHWGDVHHTLIGDLADQIADALPPDLFVTVQERVYVLTAADRDQHWVPDVATFSVQPGSVSGSEPAADLAVMEPIRIAVAEEPITEGFIEVRRMQDDRPLVTAVEVLSRTNKSTSQGREDYLAKRRDYLRAKVNLLEIDLLRGGRHLIGVPAETIRPAWQTPYKAAVRRGGHGGGVELDYYPLPLRRRLPRIRLPVGPGADVILDLQHPVDHVYRRGRYDAQIDYAVPPDPPLSADDAAWAAERIAAATR